jgi:tetratricopeptide (TPR) repeat protein
VASPPVIQPPVKVADVAPAAPVVVPPAQMHLPKIRSVSPEHILASGVGQLISINGSDFSEGASVTLHDSEGTVYADRPLLALSSATIVLKSNFGRQAGKWQVEVHNADGSKSGKFSFEVKLPQLANKELAQQAEKAAQHKVADVPTTKPEAGTSGVNKQATQITQLQQAENEYQRALQLTRQGISNEAMAGYESALKLDPAHELARQSLAGLLLEKKRTNDAEQVLKDGLQQNPRHSGFAMLLARLQVERNATPLALETLLRTLPYAEKQADYLSFVAALMQRQARHKEAIEYYQKALQIKPQSGVWLMGLGISLRAEQRNEEARDVFKRALESKTLSADLQSFVNQQLKEL